MLRKIGGLLGGVLTRFLIADIGNRMLRATWRGYSQMEGAMTFKLGVSLARLVVGLLDCRRVDK